MNAPGPPPPGTRTTSLMINGFRVVFTRPSIMGPSVVSLAISNLAHFFIPTRLILRDSAWVVLSPFRRLGTYQEGRDRRVDIQWTMWEFRNGRVARDPPISYTFRSWTRSEDAERLFPGRPSRGAAPGRGAIVGQVTCLA